MGDGSGRNLCQRTLLPLRLRRREPRLLELAEYVKGRMEALSLEHGNVGEERLLLMAALTIADELWDATSGDHPAEAIPPDAKRRA